MPIQKMMMNGMAHYRYGTSGKLYRTRAEAEKQAAAIHASGYKEPMKPKTNK